jgi:chromosomal replication initiation ATPase DnaA
MTTTQPNPIIKAVCQKFMVSQNRLCSRSRKEPLASYRLLGMALAIRCGYSTTMAARLFCRHNHTTAIHARQQVQKRMDVYPETRRQWHDLVQSLDLVKAGEQCTSSSDNSPSEAIKPQKKQRNLL